MAKQVLVTFFHLCIFGVELVALNADLGLELPFKQSYGGRLKFLTFWCLVSSSVVDFQPSKLLILCVILWTLTHFTVNENALKALSISCAFCLCLNMLCYIISSDAMFSSVCFWDVWKTRMLSWSGSKYKNTHLTCMFLRGEQMVMYWCMPCASKLCTTWTWWLYSRKSSLFFPQ